MEITCYREVACAQESLTLPAATYNLAITQLQRCPGENLFVPLRSLQYLAIIDHEEFVFIDGMRKCWIDIAWRNFHPSRRTALDEPVAYDAVYYRPDGTALMPTIARRTTARTTRTGQQKTATQSGTGHQIPRT